MRPALASLFTPTAAPTTRTAACHRQTSTLSLGPSSRFPAFYKLLGIIIQALGHIRINYHRIVSMFRTNYVVRTFAVLLAAFFLFEGPRTVLMTTIDAVGDALPIQDYLNSEWLYPTLRFKRSFKMHLSEKDLHSAKGFAEGIVDRLARHEQNLIWGKVVPQLGSSSYTAMIASWADDKALKIAKEGYINAKASVYLSNKNCARYGLSSSYCAEQLSRLVGPCKTSPCIDSSYRSFDGTCNNDLDGQIGSTYSPYARILPPAYDDGIWVARGTLKHLPSPIAISEIVQDKENRYAETTLAIVAWGNLVANDLAHTVSNRMMNSGGNIMCCTEFGFNLAPRHRHPLCMQLQDKHNTCFNYVRSMLSNSNKCQLGPAQQMNAASHFLDGSSIYGSTKDISSTLRSFSGGKLKVDISGRRPTLPKTKEAKWHRNTSYYLSGEVRINVDIVGAVLHTLLVREHNRIATLLLLLNPDWDDEEVFQETRRIVVAEIQHITYKEWLPIVIGQEEIEKQKFLQLPSSGYSNGVYNKNIDPSVLNSFANAAMKFVTSMVDDHIRLYDVKRNLVESILSREAIARPDILDEDGFLDSFVRGLATQKSQASDLTYSDAVAKYLYSTGNNSGMNAFSQDIQRGRDHGLPPYTEFRKLFGLKFESFEKLSDSIPKPVITKLKKAYNKVSEIDLLVGGMAEKPTGGALLGPVFTNLLSKQFTLTRVGDRYFYDNRHQPKPFTPAQINEIKKASIARLFCDNGDKLQQMQRKAFLKPDPERNNLIPCTDITEIPEINLKLWQEKVD